MALSCPACKKASDNSDTCPRCGADLKALHLIRAAAQSQLARGRRLLRQGRAREAQKCAAVSWDLKKSPEAARLAFLACLYLAQFDRARQWYAAAARPR